MSPNIQELSLQHQNITNIRVGDFHGLMSLTDLRIQESHVVNLQPGCFESLTRLNKLDLRRNSIKRLEAETFKGLEQLRSLNLDDNEIYHIDNVAFAGLVKLRSLSIKDNCLSGIPQGIESLATSRVDLTNNPITSVGNVGKLRHLSYLGLIQNRIPCDCKMREVKKWVLENGKTLWTIPCMDGETGSFKLIQDVSWDDLTCESPDVSIITDNGTVTGNVSLTCQTDCQEGLAFSWITPNGDYRSSTYGFSKNYNHVSKLSCKGSNIARVETKRMCYSVLSIPTIGNGTEGTYTCKVTANHTKNGSASVVYQHITANKQGNLNMAQPDNITTKPSETSTGEYNPQRLTTVWNAMVPMDGNTAEKDTPNRPPLGLSIKELILAGLASFCGGCIIIAAIAACVHKFQGIRQVDNGHRAVDGSSGNDDQRSGEGVRTESHYENDNQSSDMVADTSARDGHYENDDQFTDTGGANGGHYENDDQFSDAGGAKGGQYENDDQLSEAGGTSGGHYENEDQFSEADPHHNENDNDDFFNAGAEGRYENDDQLSASHENKNTQGTTPAKTTQTISTISRGHKRDRLVKTRALSNHPKAKLTTSMVAFHIKAQSHGHYDNERDVTSNEAHTPSTNGLSTATELSPGHYDNDKNTKDLAASSSNATGEEDSDPEYMTFPESSTEQEAEAREGNLQCERETKDKDTLSRSDSDSDMSDHGYMTFPGTENADNQDIDTENCNDKEPEMDTASVNEDESLDHTYVKFPDAEDVEERQEERGQENRLTYPADNDHVYVTFPSSDNVKE
uniref:Ig-like domain-containing protein n=1 Tax=Branchiostoma floridae TaxID=7739 RepID=C3YYE9_BRAFL|eukprot:XP_002598577.1 hypothetical protein BRAFLDRAFT_66968 [Branchiostoma floridae]